jgi:Flp pilus assembly pilin Flp
MKRNVEGREGDLRDANLRRAQRGVTSIEYALIAALIAVAIIGGVSAAGGANGAKWVAWTGAAIAAFQSVLGP